MAGAISLAAGGGFGGGPLRSDIFSFLQMIQLPQKDPGWSLHRVGVRAAPFNIRAAHQPIRQGFLKTVSPLSFDGQIMGIKMTVKATGKLGEHGLAVIGWSPVAGSTVQNLFVLGVAFSAANLAVQTWRLRPFRIDFCVTIAAGLHFNGSAETDLQGLVPVVTVRTVGKCLGGEMGLMAIGAGWYQPVLTVMTGSTGEFRVAARRSLQLQALGAVTIGTVVANLINGWCRANCMGVAVTAEALLKLGTMDGVAMAESAGRHQIGIIILCRVIGMKNGMTLAAIELMKAALILQPQKMAGVALPALLKSERLRLVRIQFRIRLGKLIAAE